MSKIRPILHDTFNLGLHLDDAYDTLKVKKAQIPEDKNFENLAAAIDSIPYRYIYSSWQELLNDESNRIENNIAVVYNKKEDLEIEKSYQYINFSVDDFLKLMENNNICEDEESYNYLNENGIFVNEHSLPIIDITEGINSFINQIPSDYKELTLYWLLGSSDCPSGSYSLEDIQNSNKFLGRISIKISNYQMTSISGESTDYRYIKLPVNHICINQIQLGGFDGHNSEPLYYFSLKPNFYHEWISETDYISYITWIVEGNDKYIDFHIEDDRLDNYKSAILSFMWENFLLLGTYSITNLNTIEPTMLNNTTPYVNLLNKIFTINDYLYGFGKYTNNQWTLMYTPIDVEPYQVLDSIYYGKNGPQMGTMSINTNLSREEILLKSEIFNSLHEISPNYLEDISYLFAGQSIVNVNASFPLAKKAFSTYRGDYSLQQVNLDFGNVENIGQLFQLDSKLQNVKLGGTEAVTDMSNMFDSCYNLININNFSTLQATNMSGLFSRCYNLTTIPNFNTNNVINMANMFFYCNSLKEIPNFNTSKVNDMSYMFIGCNNLIYENIPNFNTNNVVNMQGIFGNCNLLYTIPNLNTSKVNNMSWMLRDCPNLTIVPNFNTSNVINMSYMFINDISLEEIPNFDTSKVQKVDGMFANSGILNIPNFNFSNVTDASWLFDHTKINDFPILDFTNVQNAMGMFRGCNFFGKVPYNFSNISNMDYMFSYCNNLILENYNFNNITSAEHFFANGFNCIINNCIFIANYNLHNADYEGILSGLFYQMKDSIIDNININIAYEDWQMFQYLANCNISNVLISTVYDNVLWGKPFYDSINLNLNNITIKNIQNIQGLFADTQALNINGCTFNNISIINGLFENFQTNILDWGTFNLVFQNVTDFTNSFSNTTIQYYNNTLNLACISNINNLFSECYNLMQVDDIILDNVYDINNMFLNCYNLINIGNLVNLGHGYKKQNQINQDLNLLNCENLSISSINNIFNSVTDIWSKNNIIFSENIINNLTNEQVATVSLKGWIIPNSKVKTVGFKTVSTNNIINNKLFNTTPSASIVHSDLNNINHSEKIKELHIINWDSIGTLTNICNGFNELTHISITNCNYVHAINNMFTGCNNLTTIGLYNLGPGFKETDTIANTTLELCNMTLSNDDFDYLISCLGTPNVNAYINLSEITLNALPDNIKHKAVRKGWTINNYEWVPADFEDFVIINLNSNGSSYGFTEDSDEQGKYYKNTNQGQDDTASQMSIEITQAAIDKFGTSITLDCYYSSESVSWDYLLIQKNNTQIGKYGGEGDDWLHQEVQISDLQAGDIIYISYIKDGSVYGGYDGVKIYLPTA